MAERSTVLAVGTFVAVCAPVATAYGRVPMRPLLVALFTVGLLLAGAQRAEAAPPSWYPALRWLPAAPANYTSGRAGQAITAIVIHATEGPYAGALSWFRDPSSGVSAHYLVRASDGEITQTVAEADTAFHVRGFNRGSIGIEHEFDPAHGIEYTDALYRSSATLVCAIARRYGITPDRAHILGHSEIAGTDHSDPGPTWDWSYYMRLVRGCAGGVATASLTDSSATCDAAGCVPAAGFGLGTVSPSVSLLQWDLAYLGWLTRATVVLGDGTFGPRTVGAIRSFQAANGVPATGFYGPLTAAALARALARNPSGAPQAGLALTASSPDVERLQSGLQALGYMDLVTGYFGPVTKDAVSRFQRDRGIDPTGAYGPLTRAAMGLDLAFARR